MNEVEDLWQEETGVLVECEKKGMKSGGSLYPRTCFSTMMVNKTIITHGLSSDDSDPAPEI